MKPLRISIIKKLKTFLIICSESLTVILLAMSFGIINANLYIAGILCLVYLIVHEILFSLLSKSGLLEVLSRPYNGANVMVLPSSLRLLVVGIFIITLISGHLFAWDVYILTMLLTVVSVKTHCKRLGIE